MTKIRNSKPVLIIEYWNLKFVCNLVLEVWDLITPLLHYPSPFLLAESPEPVEGLPAG